MRLRAFVAIGLLAGCASPRAAAIADAKSVEPTEPAVAMLSPIDIPIALRGSTIAAEYFWLRVKVLEGEAPTEFAEAFDAMHDLGRDLASDATMWEDLELPLIVKGKGQVQAGSGRSQEIGGLLSLVLDVRVDGQGADLKRRCDHQRSQRELSQRHAAVVRLGRGLRVGRTREEGKAQAEFDDPAHPGKRKRICHASRPEDRPRSYPLRLARGRTTLAILVQTG